MRRPVYAVKFAKPGRKIRCSHLKNTMPLCGCSHFLPISFQR